MARHNGMEVQNEGPVEAVEQKNYDAFRTMYILLGGTGMKVGLRLRKRVLEAYGQACLPFQEYLWLDTDSRDQKSQTIDDSKAMEERLKFGTEDLVDLGLPYQRVCQFRDNPQQSEWLDSWLDRDFLKELGQHANALEGAAQIRSLGRLAFENKFAEFRSRFTKKGESLRGPQVPAQAKRFGFELDDQSLEVVIVCSLAGGTGSGCFIQVARSIAELSKNWGLSINITGYFLLPAVFSGHLQGKMYEDVQANAFAALVELNALTARQTSAPPPLHIGTFRVENPRTDPFNQIYLVSGENDRAMTFGDPRDDDAFDMVADALFLDLEKSEFGIRKRSHRCNMSPHLSNTHVLSTPVDDGDGEKRHYTFRFPTAFGAFGVARVPFDRRRYQRAAGARLAHDMLQLLVGAPEHEVANAQIERTIVQKSIKDFHLLPTDIVDALLRDGGTADVPFIYKPHLDSIQIFFKAEGEKIERHFAAEGLSESERLRRIREADGFSRTLMDRISQHFREVMDRVDGLLNQEGVRSNHGKHGKAINDARDAVLRDSRDKLRELIVGQLARPLEYGLDIADKVLEKLADSFSEGFTLQAADRPELPKFQLLKDHSVESALELRDAADALWLPGYGQIARRYCRRHHKRLLSEAGSHMAKKIRAELIDVAQASLIAWVERRYRRAAGERCERILEELGRYVGKSVEVRNDRGEITVETHGMRQELGLYREAIEQTQTWFDELENSYKRTFISMRHARDRTPWDSLGHELERFLSGESLNRPNVNQILLDQWDKFLVDQRILGAGTGETVQQGIQLILKWAVARQKDQANWLKLKNQLESWTALRMQQGVGLASEHDAMSLIGGGDADKQAALNQAGKGASPWLRFRQDDGQLDYLHDLAVIGVQNKAAQAVSTWSKEQTGTMEALMSDGGSAVVYMEKMAFPLYVIAALDDLHGAYNEVKKRGDLDLAKRHTERAFLELPHVIPPANPGVAQRWFELDRLALEAVLLGVFTQCKGNTISYVVQNQETGVRRTISLPNSLEAISNRFRDEVSLVETIQADVLNRRRLALCRPDHAEKALALASWTQNVAFPRAAAGKHFLEHDLSASLMSLWSREVERLLDIPRATLIHQAGIGEAQVEEWTTTCTLRSRQLSRGSKLRMLSLDLRADLEPSSSAAGSTSSIFG